MKVIYYDLETTGVKHWKHGIHQIAGIIEIDGVEVEEFNFDVRPPDKAAYEPEAFAMKTITPEDCLGYPPISEVHAKLVDILAKYVDRYDKKDKFFLAGFNNASFDNQFLRMFFELAGDPYFGSYFWANSIDVMVVASHYLREERTKLQDFKLGTVARYLGIPFEEEKLHDALYDIRITKAVYGLVQIW